jgi:Arc/MetJ-type ribon-helix-helix transcriptional regulator
MPNRLRPVTIKLGPEMVEQIRMMADKRGETISDTVRYLIRRGLDERVYKENMDMITGIVKEQLELALQALGLASSGMPGLKLDRDLIDERVVLRRAFKDRECKIEKVQVRSWGK